VWVRGGRAMRGYVGTQRRDKEAARGSERQQVIRSNVQVEVL